MCCAAKHQFVGDEITIVKQMMNFHLQTFWCVLKKAYCQELRGFESVKSELQIVIFLAHPRQRLKWSFLIEICPLSVVVRIVNFYHFVFSKTTEPLSTKLSWAQSIFQVYSNEGLHTFPRGNESYLWKGIANF